jgi:hypothetical protein
MVSPQHHNRPGKFPAMIARLLFLYFLRNIPTVGWVGGGFSPLPLRRMITITL